MFAAATEQHRTTVSRKGLGEAIRIIRRRRLGLNQQQLAERLGLSRHSTISDWERGAVTPPPERLEQIAELVGEDVTELFGNLRRAARSQEETPEQAVALTFPDASDLGSRAREFYNRKLGEWVQRWSLPVAVRAANDLLLPFRGANTMRKVGVQIPALTEEQQLMVLEGQAEDVQEAYDEAGARGR